MDFQLSEDQQTIRATVAELAGKFDDHYWMSKDLAHEFPTEFYDAFADGGWLGITTPEEYGGHGFGITEASILLEEVAASGAGMNGASSMHMSIFGMHPVIVHGSDELKARNLPRIVTGDLHVCFGVTEPGAGLDTTKITTFARREGDHYVVNGRKVWISKALESEKILLLTRTTKFEDAKRKTDGMTLFFTDLDRSKVDDSADSEDGPKRGLLQRAFHRRPRNSRRGPRRRGRSGLPLHPRRTQPRAVPDRRRGAGHRTRRTACRGAVRQRARGVRPPDRHEPGTAISVGRLVGPSGRRRVGAAQGHLALRQR